jgi:hypothetical protein
MRANDWKQAKCMEAGYFCSMPHLNCETAARTSAPLFSTMQWSVVAATGEPDSSKRAEAVDQPCAYQLTLAGEELRAIDMQQGKWGCAGYTARFPGTISNLRL